VRSYRAQIAPRPRHGVKAPGPVTRHRNGQRGPALYRFDTGGAIAGGVVTYAVAGRQYVAAVSGGGSFFFGSGKGAPSLVVFALQPASPR